MDAPRTIREAIQRQGPKRIAPITGFVIAALGMAAFVLAGHRTGHSASFPVVPLVVAGVLLVLMVVGLRTSAKSLRTKCPKCGNDLGVLVYLMQDTPRSKKINFCPYCAVNLDDPLPEAPAATENVTTPDKLIWK